MKGVVPFWIAFSFEVPRSAKNSKTINFQKKIQLGYEKTHNFVLNSKALKKL
jgi:hypothetical protein